MATLEGGSTPPSEDHHWRLQVWGVELGRNVLFSAIALLLVIVATVTTLSLFGYDVKIGPPEWLLIKVRHGADWTAVKSEENREYFDLKCEYRFKILEDVGYGDLNGTEPYVFYPTVVLSKLLMSAYGSILFTVHYDNKNIAIRALPNVKPFNALLEKRCTN